MADSRPPAGVCSPGPESVRDSGPRLIQCVRRPVLTQRTEVIEDPERAAVRREG